MLSIIVPVYNVASYLRRCVESLLNQAWDDYEIILINDGSQDNSGLICDELAAVDARIKVMHKLNGGLSDARNAGIDVAAGDYLMFVDSDDALIQHICDKLYNTANTNNLDVLYFGVNWIKDNKTKAIWKQNTTCNVICTGKDFLTDELSSGKFLAMAPCGIYKKSFLVENGLYFKKGILHEDEQWSPRVIVHATRIMRIEDFIYDYFIRDGSITTNMSLLKRRANDALEVAKELYEIYNSEDGELKKYGLIYVSKLYMSGLSKARLAGDRIKIDRRYIMVGETGLRGWLKRRLFVVTPYCYGKLLIRRSNL